MTLRVLREIAWRSLLCALLTSWDVRSESLLLDGTVCHKGIEHAPCFCPIFKSYFYFFFLTFYLPARIIVLNKIHVCDNSCLAFKNGSALYSVPSSNQGGRSWQVRGGGYPRTALCFTVRSHCVTRGQFMRPTHREAKLKRWSLEQKKVYFQAELGGRGGSRPRKPRTP